MTGIARYEILNCLFGVADLTTETQRYTEGHRVLRMMQVSVFLCAPLCVSVVN
jgi:hypothetical protein